MEKNVYLNIIENKRKKCIEKLKETNNKNNTIFTVVNIEAYKYTDLTKEETVYKLKTLETEKEILNEITEAQIKIGNLKVNNKNLLRKVLCMDGTDYFKILGYANHNRADIPQDYIDFNKIEILIPIKNIDSNNNYILYAGGRNKRSRKTKKRSRKTKKRQRK
jgi:hypothetical protein